MKRLLAILFTLILNSCSDTRLHSSQLELIECTCEVKNWLEMDDMGDVISSSIWSICNAQYHDTIFAADTVKFDIIATGQPGPPFLLKIDSGFTRNVIFK